MNRDPRDWIRELKQDKKKFAIAVFAVLGIFLIGVSALLPDGEKADPGVGAAVKNTFDEEAYTEQLEDKIYSMVY